MASSLMRVYFHSFRAFIYLSELVSCRALEWLARLAVVSGEPLQLLSAAKDKLKAGEIKENRLKQITEMH